MTRMTNLVRGASYQLEGTLDSCVCPIECCGVSLPRISSDEPTSGIGALQIREFSYVYYIYSNMESVFMERNHPIAIWPCFDFLSRDRSGGSSVIGYHLPESGSVFVG